MLAVKSMDVRDNFKSLCDKVFSGETLIISRPKNENIVMISEESYNNLMENVYIMGNKANFDWLMESKEQLERGKISVKELAGVEDDE